MKLIILFNILFMANSFGSFLPKNELNIPLNELILEQALNPKYSALNELVLSLYKNEISIEGGTLNIDFDMTSTRVNAFATRTGTKLEYWNIRFLGGLLGHKSMNEFIYLGVLCHELGHHLGGLPKKAEGSWVSVEGQADYFTGHECLKNILKNKNPLSFPKLKLPAFAINKCRERFSIESELKLCFESTFISMEIGKFLFKINRGRRGNRSAKPLITKRATNIMTTTNIKHPKPQCRLDTFFEGSLCSAFYRGDKACQDSQEWYLGARPLCWYKP